jgi:hypothetical protein
LNIHSLSVSFERKHLALHLRPKRLAGVYSHFSGIKRPQELANEPGFSNMDMRAFSLADVTF